MQPLRKSTCEVLPVRPIPTVSSVTRVSHDEPRLPPPITAEIPDWSASPPHQRDPHHTRVMENTPCPSSRPHRRGQLTYIYRAPTNPGKHTPREITQRKNTRTRELRVRHSPKHQNPLATCTHSHTRCHKASSMGPAREPRSPSAPSPRAGAGHPNPLPNRSYTAADQDPTSRAKPPGRDMCRNISGGSWPCSTTGALTPSPQPSYS